MKKKILVIALAMAVMLMGAGYAYWTDQLTIDSTVATGEFDVNFTAASGGGGDRNLGSATTNWNKYLSVDADVIDEGKGVKATMNNLYPGSIAHLSLTIENNGTLPAVLDSADVNYTVSGAAIENEIFYRIDYTLYDKDGNNVTPTNRPFIWDDGLQSYEENLNKLLKGLVLEPGWTAVISDPVSEDGGDLANKYTFELPSGVTTCENESFNLVIKMNWKQHNDTTDYSAVAPVDGE